MAKWTVLPPTFCAATPVGPTTSTPFGSWRSFLSVMALNTLDLPQPGAPNYATVNQYTTQQNDRLDRIAAGQEMRERQPVRIRRSRFRPVRLRHDHEPDALQDRSEDRKKNEEEAIQGLTNKFIAEIDKLLAVKESEIMSI